MCWAIIGHSLFILMITVQEEVRQKDDEIEDLR